MMRRMNFRSFVHDEFFMVTVFQHHKGERDGKECIHCGAKIVGSNTTNLFNHLRSFHKVVYDEVKLKDGKLKEELIIGVIPVKDSLPIFDKAKIGDHTEKHQDSFEEKPSEYESKPETSILMWKKTLTDYMSSGNIEDKTLNVRIHCSDGTVFTHKLVLASISPRMYLAMKNIISENNLKV